LTVNKLIPWYKFYLRFYKVSEADIGKRGNYDELGKPLADCNKIEDGQFCWPRSVGRVY